MQMTNRTSENGTGRGNHLSILSRIDFPKFEGDDVQGWIHKCKQFFEVDSVMENRKVKISFIHLCGRALIWHQSYMKGVMAGNGPTFEEYKSTTVAQFSSGPFDDP